MLPDPNYFRRALNRVKLVYFFKVCCLDIPAYNSRSAAAIKMSSASDTVQKNKVGKT